MTLDEELRLSYYKQISPLNEEHGVWLVQHVENRRIYVRKRLTTFDIGVIRRLMEQPVPGIPQIIEAAVDGQELIVIEQYADGEPLSRVLEKRGPLKADEALSYAKQLAVILGRLHGMKPKVIHRDIKPSNVIVSENGTVTLIDLDAAKSCKQWETRDTELIGTVGYAAPEQYGFGASSPETDIYSLGVLLSVMLTGKLPSECRVEGRLGRVIAKCTDIDPSRRYRSTEELLEALGGCGGASVKTASEKTRFSKYRPLGFRSLTPWKMILAGLFYLAMIGVAALAHFDHYNTPVEVFLRIWTALTLIYLVLFPSNFCGILDKLGVNSIKNKAGRVTVIVFLEFLIFFGSVFLMAYIAHAFG